MTLCECRWRSAVKGERNPQFTFRDLTGARVQYCRKLNVEKSTYCVEVAVFFTIAPMIRTTFSRFSAWVHLHFTMPFVFLLDGIRFILWGNKNSRVIVFQSSCRLEGYHTGWPDQNSLSWSRFFIRAPMEEVLVRRIDRFLMLASYHTVGTRWWWCYNIPDFRFCSRTRPKNETKGVKRIRYSYPYSE
jgi:hypothetical protein